MHYEDVEVKGRRKEVSVIESCAVGKLLRQVRTIGGEEGSKS